MKKNILIAALAFIIAACNAPAKKSGYTVTGDLSGITGKVYLTQFEGKMPLRIDSAKVTNGKFTFTGDIGTPILASIQNDKGDIVRFFLEDSEITINGSANNPANITVTGSATEELYRKMEKEIAALYDSMPTVPRETWDSIENTATNIRKEFVKKNPLSVAAAYVLYRELSYAMTPDELDSYLAGFDPSIRSSVYYKLVESMSSALKKTAVGQKYTDISVPNKDGKPVALSSFIDERKYVLLDFWASWCPPCRAEIPNLAAAYKVYASKGFEIYSVSLDRNHEDWLNGIAYMKMNWINVSTLTFWESEAAAIYGVRSIPSNILIAPDGTIIARNLEGEALHTKLAELFANK